MIWIDWFWRGEFPPGLVRYGIWDFSVRMWFRGRERFLSLRELRLGGRLQTLLSRLARSIW